MKVYTLYIKFIHTNSDKDWVFAVIHHILLFFSEMSKAEIFRILALCSSIKLFLIVTHLEAITIEGGQINGSI